MSLLLGCKSLSVQFYGQTEPVLKDITLQFHPGETVLILGPSGSGKSTLLAVLAGIIPEHMEAILKGEANRKQSVGILFQDPDTQFCMQHVDDEIAFSLENKQVPKEQMNSIIKELLDVVGLEVEPDTRIDALSGGMKQRLALACILALKPEVLFLDEPTAQLDPLSRREIFKLLKQISERKEQTLIIVEHVLDGCIEWADRVILLNKEGRIIGDGHPKSILSDYQSEIEEAGIWRPEIYPFEWDEIINDNSHPLSMQLRERYLHRKANTKRTAQEGLGSLLEVQNLSISYEKKEIFNNLNFRFGKGEWISIIGKNGSGKSSLLKVLANLKKRSKGTITFKERELKNWKDSQLYEHVGFVFQNPEWQFITQTVYKEIAFSGEQHKWKKEVVEAKTLALLKEFGLFKHKDYNPFNLSFGQKRRLSVATMLLLHQDILFLDEPTFGQDKVTTEKLLRLLKKRQEQGTTIVMATHDMNIVDQHSDRVLLLKESSLIYDGKPFSLFSNSQLLEHTAIIPPMHYVYRQEAKEEFPNGGKSVVSVSY